MQVLLELSAHAGEVVSKDNLIRAVWPNTFVGDDVLIRCISELRHVFEDNPRSPRVIQTISKMGYRLIAPVSVITSGSSATPSSSPAAPEPLGSDPAAVQAKSLQPSSTSPSVSKLVPIRALSAKAWAVLAVAALLLVAGLSGIVVSRRTSSSAEAFRVVPFTSYPGSERQPTFSPDGNQIAFSWNGGEAGDSWNLYVKLIGSETPLRLTSGPADDLNPAWSPDGKSIAFIRRSPQGNAIYLIPAIGGPEQKIFDLHCAIDWDEPGLSWSPDGKQLVFPDGKSEASPSAIYSLSLDSRTAQPLSSPRNSWDGDFSPVFSPDGSKIAFVRGTDIGSRNVYVMDASGGVPKQLTFLDYQQIHGLTWMKNGSSIVFSSDAGGTASLWRIPVSGGTAQRLPFGSDNAFTPMISRAGGRLAYSQGSDTWSLVRIDTKSPHSPAVKLISSTEQDSAPKFSHNGQYVAFQSWRSGTQEIWVSSADNARPMKLTSFNGPLTGSPSWSPDDTQIAFDSRVHGRSHIFVMSANGGAPKSLTDGDFNDIVPNWSNDGRWIYFSSRRNGSWQIWKVSLASRQVQQVTRNGGFVAQESADGKWLYYTKYDMPGLWRVPASGGNEVQILNNPPAGFWAYFSPCATGIYLLTIEGSRSIISFYDFDRNNLVPIYTLARRPALFSGLSVTGRWVLYTDTVSRNGDIVLVDRFR